MRPQAVNVPLLLTEGAWEGAREGLLVGRAVSIPGPRSTRTAVGANVPLPHLRLAFLRSRCRCFQRCHRGGERLAFLGRWPTFQRPCAETSRCRSRSSKTRTVYRDALLGRFFGVRHPECIACCGWMREGGGRGQIRGAKAVDRSIDQLIDRDRNHTLASPIHCRACIRAFSTPISARWPGLINHLRSAWASSFHFYQRSGWWPISLFVAAAGLVAAHASRVGECWRRSLCAVDDG